MFRSKRDVDRHVNHVINRIRDVKERKSRGYQFAKLYFEVSDYESAKRYLQEFLTIREAVPQAQKLMGQICEALHDVNKALEAYKRSLDLDPDQKDVVLKVCELYCDPSLQVNPDIVKIWIESAENHFPGHHTVFKLKERVIEKDNEGYSGDLEKLINAELAKNPKDVKLHIRLLKLYRQSGQADRAYHYAVKTEKKLPFPTSVDWYECLTDSYQFYQDQHGVGDDVLFYTHKLFAVCILTSLRLQNEDRDLSTTVKALHLFDQSLDEVQAIQKQSTEWDNFLTEMRGQFFYMTGLLIIKRALKGQLSWKDASSFSAVCFLLSNSLQVIDQKSSWYCQLNQDRKKFYEHVHMLGCDRLSQGGHVVLSFQHKQDGSQWVRKLRQKLCTAQGLETLRNIVFTDGDMRRKKDDSFLSKNTVFTGNNLDFPSKSELLKYDSAAFVLHADRLNHLVWLALRYHTFKDEVQNDYEQLFGNQLFPSMKFGMMDLSGGDPGTLCQLDTQVFLYVSVRWVAMQQRENKRNLHPIPDKPELLPVCLSNNLCTIQQTEWWSTVHRLQAKTANEKLAKLFGVVIRGLETIRLVDPHTIPLSLVVHVARTLDKRAEEMESLDAEGIVSPRLQSVLTRAAFYWKCAEAMLDRIDRNSSIKMPKEMLFPDLVSIKDLTEIRDFRQHIKFALACVAMREERYEEALSSFENLPQAKAAYYMGMVYRKLYESLDVNSNSATGGATNSQQTALLSRAKDSLYKALDRLESENDEALKETVKEELDGIVCKLISVESGGNLVDSILSNHSEAYSTAESEESIEDEPIKMPKTPITSSPVKYNKQVVNPSPTRIEVQFKALESANTAFSSRLSTLEETVRMNEKLIQELFTQLRESRDENRSLREQIQILSFQGLSNINMSIQRPSIGQSFPGTTQPRNVLNVMNNSYAAAPPTYDYQVPTAIPQHLAQYGYPGGSPRPGSAYGQPNFEDELNNIDGEYYDPDVEGECYIPDQNLIQEWPFGHKTGVEGKSTITYSPQHVGKGLGQANAGMFVNALRGPSIQYGAYQQPAVPPQATPQMPGPGYFSQNNQQGMPPAVQTQSAVYPGQNQLGMMMNMAGTSPSLSPAFPPKIPGASITRPSTTTMMPPNAVMTSTIEARPKLIPGSVGVPTPKPQPGSNLQPVLTTPAATSAVPSAEQKGKAPQSTPGSGILGFSALGSTGQSPQIPVGPSAPGILGQTTPGSAASMLSQLAAKQQQPAQTSTGTPVTSTPQKTVFKGFSFTSTPKINEPKADAANTEKENKSKTTASEVSKPFAGFAFTQTKVSTVVTPTSSTKVGVDSRTPASQTQSTPQTGSGFLFGKGASQSPSFGAVAAKGSTDSAFKGTQDSVFVGTGLPVFGKTPSPRRRDPSGSDDHVEEYEPTVDFKPLVPLPDLIQVKTGEEDEEKWFSERAKLFRFDMESNQWKERGIGEMKILKHKEKTQFRVLMRREQVLKLCANHMINAGMKLAQMASSDKAWVWSAADFSEEEMKPEKFAARFKTVDKADEFKRIFEKCLEELEKVKETKDKDVKSETANSATKGVNSSKEKQSLAEMFRPKAGSWKCDGCLVQNGPEIIKCGCCGTIKPGATPEELNSISASSFQSGSVTPGQGGTTFQFGIPSSSTSTSGIVSKEGADSTTKPGTAPIGFKFGITKDTSVPTENSTTKVDLTGKSVPQESNTATGQKGLSELFKPTPASSAQVGTQQDDKSGFKFGVGGGGGFTFGTASKPETKSSTPAFNVSSAGGGSATNESKSEFVFGSPAAPKPQSTGFIFGTQTSTPATTSPSGFAFGKPAESKPTTTPNQNQEATSAGFNVNKEETKYTFGTAGPPTSTIEQDDTVSSGNSLLAKYLTCPDSWTCYKCKTKLEGLTDICSSCNVTREESLKKEEEESALTGSSEPSGFTFKTASSGAFMPSKSSSEGFNFSFPPASDPQKPQPPAAVGSGFNFSLSITRSLTDTTPTKSTTQASIIASPKSPEVTEDGYYVNKDEDDSHIYFEPIVPLPAKVDVKLGEEEEEAVFTHRAKLYRFIDKEWKERGLGDIKLLYHVQNKKARLVMRRDAILKLCCNHYITQDITFRPMPNSNNCALVWYAMDFSEDEAKLEQFAIKFRNAEIVSKFEAAIQDVKDRMGGASSETPRKTTNIETVGAKTVTATESTTDGELTVDSDVIITKVEKATDEQVEKARKYKLPDHFYLYENLPDCPGCRGCDENWTYEAEVEKYQKYQTADAEEGHDDDDDDDDDYDTDEYEDYEDEEEEEENEAKSGRERYRNSEVTVGNAKGSEEDQELVFGKSAGAGFSFASLAKTSPSKPFGQDTGTPFHWEGAGKQLFGAATGAGDRDSDGEGDVQQGDDPQFEPIIALPELVDVKTGEEDEVAVYSQRAKLFRFDKNVNQWKEKGIGEMKILRHESTGKYRLLLRREQVHKLACNHLLTAELLFMPMNTSETSWCWTTTDFSEPEGNNEQLAVKFKTVELASAFKKKIDQIQNLLSKDT